MNSFEGRNSSATKPILRFFRTTWEAPLQRSVILPSGCLPQRSTELWRMRSKKQAPADCAIRMTDMKQADQLRIAR